MSQKFLSNIELNAGLVDGNDTTGTSGQVLTSTGTGVEWIDQAAITGSGSNKTYYEVKNSSGATILKGKGVMAVGADGNSGHILIDEMVADGTIEPRYFMGVLEDSLDNGEIGTVIAFGELDQFNTNGQNGETWVDGQILWCDPDSAGDFTTTQPTAPAVKIPAAFILKASTQGKIQIRVQANEGLHELHDTHITTQSDGEILVWDNTNEYWFNDSTLTVDYTNGRVGMSSYGGGAYLYTLGSFRIDIDSNNDATDRAFIVSKDNAATQLFKVEESGAVTLSGALKGPSTFYIDPSPDDTYGDATTDTGTVVILGDLQVTGQTTTVNSTVVDIADLNLTLASNATTASEANGAGITIGGASATLTYASATDDFHFNKTVNAGTFVGALTGNVTGNVTGNADTATSAGKWTTARTITLGGDLTGNVSIDGSANVTLTASVVDDSHNHDGRYYTETEADSRFIRDLGDVNVTDFDTLSDGWLGSNETTATNQPYANHHNTFTITNDASAGRKTQLFFADSPGGGFYFRQRQGDITGWHDWQKVWSSYDFSSTQISNWDSAYGLLDGGTITGQLIVSTSSSPAIKISKNSASDNRFLRLENTETNGKSWDLINQTVANSNTLMFYNHTDDVAALTISTGGNLTAPGNIYASGGNSTEWNTAYGWGDWGTGVTKAFVDALNIDADTIDGLDSTKFFRKDQDLEFDRAATRKIIFNSDTNYNSDLAFLYFNENSSFHRAGTENVRFSIGTFNDFSNSSSHSDSLDLQGGGRLYLNVGNWDTELTSAIGTAGTGAYLDAEPIQFAINNTKVGSFSSGGNFGINVNGAEEKLHVGGAIKLTTNPSVTGDTGSAKFWNQSGVGPTIAGSNFQIRTNGNTHAVTVDSNQRVGINTVSPSSPLHVKSDAIDNVGMVLFENDHSAGGVYFPSLSVINTRGNHSFGIVAEFRTNTSADTDKPSILFYGEQSATSWQVGQVTGTNWGPTNAFGIGYRASNDPTTFTGWPTDYFTIDTSGNVNIPEGNLTVGSDLSIGGNIYMTGSLLQFANNDGFSYNDSTNVMSVRYDGTDYPIISSANIGSQSVSYANNAGNLDGLDSTEFEQYVRHTVDMSNTSTYAEDTYYPVTIPVGLETTIKVEVRLNSGSTPSWSTHSSGFSINLVWTTNGSGWGTTYVSRRIHKWTERWTNQTICGGITQMENSSNEVVYLRGGGKYWIYTSKQTTVTPRSSSYTASSQTVSPTTSIVNKVWDMSAGSFGVANLKVRDTITLYDSPNNAETVYITTNPRGGGTNDADMRLGNSNNGDVMTIHNDQVGIGTTGPSQKLEVAGNIKTSGTSGATATPDYLWLGNNYSNGTTRDKCKIFLYNNGTEQYGFSVGSIGDVQYHSNSIHDFYISNGHAMRINSSGNVGIGTDSPTGKLNIQQSSLDTAALFIGRYNAEDSPIIQIGESTSFSGTGTFGEALIASRNRDIVFSTGDFQSLSSVSTAALIIEKGEGNVGIGTDSPSAKLEVKDTSTSTALTITSDGGNEQLVIRRYSNTNEHLILGFNSGDYGTIQAVEQGVAYRNLVLNASGGNVGIGKTSLGYKLDVNGSFRAESQIYTPSYVQADSVRATNSGDAVGISFRATYECISGEGWCTAQYAYNNNDGFLFLNRDSTGGTARPTFHIGGKNNASHGGWAADDSIITLVRSDGTKSTGSTYSHRGLSNSAYYTNIVKTTAHTEFKDAQGVHKFNGTLRAGGDVVAYHSSDSRLKDNIKPIENAIDKVKKIGGYEFDWNDNQNTHEGHDVGVIAQEIEEVLPEVVTERDNGYKAVKYEKLVALLIQGMKEQQEQIDELKRRLDGSTN